MEAKAAENVVRSYLLRLKPSVHEICQELPSDSFSCRPQPDEAFEFPGGTLVVEYEALNPVQSVQKYWWLLHNTDYLEEKGKVALVVLVLDPYAQPADQVEREKSLAAKLEAEFPGRFSYFHVGADEVSNDTISTALANAYEAVRG